MSAPRRSSRQDSCEWPPSPVFVSLLAKFTGSNWARSWMKRSRSRPIRSAPPATIFSFSQEAPFLRLLDQKRAKSKDYRSEGEPVGLLMWFDLTLGTAENLERLVSKHRDKLDDVLGRGSFVKVWTCDR